MKEKQLLTNTEWEVCECLWEDSPLTMTQIAARLTERTGWTKSTGETLVRRMAEREELSREEIDQLYEALRKLEEKGHD